MKKLMLSALSLLLSVYVFAQDSTMQQSNLPATGLRADGKIYVVIVVLLTILAGITVYLVRLDRKISRLEKFEH